MKSPTIPWLSQRPILIGMLHLPPLPGSPRFSGSMTAILNRVLSDVAAYEHGGMRSLMVENFGDTPFYPGAVPNVTIAHMTAIAQQVRNSFPNMQLGINALRNDGCAALAIAHAVGAEFIRVNVLCGARVTDQGLVTGIAHDLLRLRAQLHAEHIAILADVDVKHSAPLGVRPLRDEVDDLIHRGGADAVIVSGNATGQPVDLGQLRSVAQAASPVPVLIGSGATTRTIGSLLSVASGAIVGSALKRDGQAEQEVDAERVREFVQAAKICGI